MTLYDCCKNLHRKVFAFLLIIISILWNVLPQIAIWMSTTKIVDDSGHEIPKIQASLMAFIMAPILMVMAYFIIFLILIMFIAIFFDGVFRFAEYIATGKTVVYDRINKKFDRKVC